MFFLYQTLRTPTSPVSYSSSASCSSTTLAKLLALEDERDRSWASGMDGALQHIDKLHTWVTLSLKEYSSDISTTHSNDSGSFLCCISVLLERFSTTASPFMSNLS